MSELKFQHGNKGAQLGNNLITVFDREDRTADSNMTSAIVQLLNTLKIERAEAWLYREAPEFGTQIFALDTIWSPRPRLFLDGPLRVGIYLGNGFVAVLPWTVPHKPAGATVLPESPPQEQASEPPAVLFKPGDAVCFKDDVMHQSKLYVQQHSCGTVVRCNAEECLVKFLYSSLLITVQPSVLCLRPAPAGEE